MLDSSEYKTFLGIWENSYKTSVLLEKIFIRIKTNKFEVRGDKN